jgi:predicted N-formylglutamate amidohydrolase
VPSERGGDSLLITCEHGGKRVPPACAAHFRGHEELLASHRGYDPGALSLAMSLARTLQAELHYATISRLVIDLNRSRGHPRLYSEATRDAPAELRREILARHYLPYRDRIETCVARSVAQGRRVIHIASHSFTPVLGDEVRKADIGLLYDPSRPAEVALCGRWRATLQALAPGLRVRRNYPYTGKSDGLTAYLRRRFHANAYVGIELEVNQRHVFQGGRHWSGMRQQIVAALLQSLDQPG